MSDSDGITHLETRPRGPVWVAVLVKDFSTAKQRLRPALDPRARRRLARQNARRALLAAGAGDHVVAVCGSQDAADLARAADVEVLLEHEPMGQNAAARRGVELALSGGAGAVLLISSDLPLVGRGVVGEMLKAGCLLESPAVLAAPATGRGGTNALYLSPPDAIDLHFGPDSLREFERDAATRGVRFALFDSPELALDLDEPSDLAMLAARS